MRFPARIAALAAAVAVVILAACRDREITAPNANAIADWRASASVNAAPCLTQTQLNTLSDSVFSGGGPNSNSVKSKIDQIVKAKAKNDQAKATAAAFDAVRFVFQKFKGPQPLNSTPAQVGRLITGIFCIAGLNITVTDPTNAYLIDPSATTQVVKSADSTAGTKLPPGSIAEPTVLEFKKVANIYAGHPGAGPLNTRLDQYPGFFLITAGTASGSGPAGPVTVAICPDATVPTGVRGRLRLGHEKTGGVFEVTPPADASFLTCPAPVSVGFLPGWADKALSKLLPRTLYAAVAQEPFRGGVGGTASEFSPFDPVDPELAFRGGVGGTAGEFIKKGPLSPLAPAPAGPTRPSGSVSANAAEGVAATPGSAASIALPPCAAPEAVWSTQLPQACRPGIVVTTALGTVMRNVPVTWTVTAGGGTIATEVLGGSGCGAFGASAVNTTSDTGRAGVCWTMGPTPGANAVVATPSLGGDAIPGVTFTPTSKAFSALAIKATPVVAITCPPSVVFTGNDQTPCTAAVTDPIHALSLGSVAPSYLPATPHDVATYTVNASFAATTLYFDATSQTTFAITPAPTVTAVTCTAGPFTYSGSAYTPCSATVTGVGGLNAAVTPVNYTSNVGAGDALASATYAATLNYQSSNGVATFVIAKAPTTTTASCAPGSITYTGGPITPCTGHVSGTAGLSQDLSPTYSGNLNVGTATGTATYDGTNNYLASTAFATFEITPAPTTTTVTCAAATAVFTGSPIAPCAAQTNGPAGPNAAVAPVNYTSNVNVGPVSASATYVGDGNHSPSSGSATFQITPAPTVTQVTCSAASYTYTGSPFAECSAHVTGPGLAAPVTPVSYSPGNVNVGMVTASAGFVGGGNYVASSGFTSFQITPATPTVNIQCLNAPYTGANVFPCSAQAYGVGAVLLTPTVPISYSPTDPPKLPGLYTATTTLPAGGNYTSATASATFSINGIVGNFADGFETASAWTPSGFWNRNTLTGITNVLLAAGIMQLAPGDGSAGSLPSPFTGSYAYWFGQSANGNYLGAAASVGNAPGGTGSTAVSGTLTSPNIGVSASLLQTPVLEFDTWWEIESVNPRYFDLMQIAILDVSHAVPDSLGVLNPLVDHGPASAKIPHTSAGYDLPPVWTHYSLNLSAYRGKTIRVIFSFNSRDVLYNGFRGWIVDNVQVSNAMAGLRASPVGDRTVYELNPVPPLAVRTPE